MGSYWRQIISVRRFPDEVTYCQTIEEAITNADLCLIFTEWPEVKQFDVKKYSELMNHPIVIDGRNCYFYCCRRGRNYL